MLLSASLKWKFRHITRTRLCLTDAYQEREKNVDLNKSFAKKKSNDTATAHIKNSIKHIREIEQDLGLFLLRPCIEKTGRYWFGITNWIDKRNNRPYSLATKKQGQKLKTYLNTKPILGNGVAVADYTTVTKEQEQAKAYVFKLLVASYQTNNTIMPDELFHSGT
jgi:hypothetical protein